MDLLLSRFIVIKSFLLFRSTGSILWFFWRTSIIEERRNRKRTLLNNHKKIIKIKKIIKKEKHKYRKIKIPNGRIQIQLVLSFSSHYPSNCSPRGQTASGEKELGLYCSSAQEQQEVICNWPHPIHRDKTTHCRQTHGKLKLQDVIRSDNR